MQTERVFQMANMLSTQFTGNENTIVIFHNLICSSTRQNHGYRDRDKNYQQRSVLSFLAANQSLHLSLSRKFT